MKSDWREGKDSIHSGNPAGAEDLGEAITRLDLHYGADDETVEEAPALAEANVCARCGAGLQSLTTVAWCLRCGYTKKLEDVQETPSKLQEDLDVRRYLSLLHAQSERQKREMQLSTLKLGETYIPILPIRGLEVIPEWLAVLLCGLLICAIGSATAAVNLRTSPEPRLIWCLAQAGAGAVLLILAQPLAFLLVVPRKLRFRELLKLFSPWLWLMAWRGLPQTRLAFWALFWGIGLVAGAALIRAASLYGWV